MTLSAAASIDCEAVNYCNKTQEMNGSGVRAGCGIGLGSVTVHYGLLPALASVQCFGWDWARISRQTDRVVKMSGL